MKAIIVIDIPDDHIHKTAMDLYNRLEGYECELKPMPKRKESIDDYYGWNMMCQGWNACLSEIERDKDDWQIPVNETWVIPKEIDEKCAKNVMTAYTQNTPQPPGMIRQSLNALWAGMNGGKKMKNARNSTKSEMTENGSRNRNGLLSIGPIPGRRS